DQRDASRTRIAPTRWSANGVLRATGEAAGAVDCANDEVSRLLATAFDADRIFSPLRRRPARVDDRRLDHLLADHGGGGILAAHLEHTAALSDVLRLALHARDQFLLRLTARGEKRRADHQISRALEH